MKKLIISISIILLAVSGFSQGLFIANYNISLGVGETSDYIGKVSFRGATFEGRGFLSDNISLGGSINWTTFYERMEDDTYTDGSLSLSGVQYRYLNSCPILATAHFYTGSPDGGMRAYGGLGVGTYYVNKTNEMGIWMTEDSKWHFGLAPEIGVLIPVGFSGNINLGLKWNYAFKANDSSAYNWLGLNIGFAFGS